MSKRTEVVKREERSLEQRLGEIDLNDHVACALLLDDIRQLESQLGSAKQALTRALVDKARVDGVTAFELPGRMRAEIRAGTRTSYSPEVLEQGLRKAGMSDERIGEIITQTVSYSVDARELKKAAGVNPAYAKAMEAAKSTHQAQPSVTLRRR